MLVYIKGSGLQIRIPTHASLTSALEMGMVVTTDPDLAAPTPDLIVALSTPTMAQREHAQARGAARVAPPCEFFGGGGHDDPGRVLHFVHSLSPKKKCSILWKKLIVIVSIPLAVLVEMFSWY